MKPYRIFLSSPGDCNDERSLVHELAAKLNSDPLVSNFTRVEVIAWDWGAGVPLDALASPQTAVNKYLPTPEDCDLFVGIFNCRFGTPLPANEFRKPDGKPYLSGSEYEFHRAWESRRRGSSKPEILVYRCKNETSSCADQAQLSNLNHFFQQPPFKESQQWQGSLNSYQTPNEFVGNLEGHLRRLLSQRQPSAIPVFSDWLSEQATLLATNAGPRYTANAHVKTDIQQVFDWLLTRPSAISELDKALSEVWKQINHDAVFSELKADMSLIAEAMREDQYWQSSPDFSFMISTLDKIEDLAISEEKLHEAAKAQTEEWRFREHRLRQAYSDARNAKRLLQSYSGLTQKRVLLLTGEAGQGKTHTLVHEIKQTLANGGVAVGVLGQTLNASGGLWHAVCHRLGWLSTHQQLLDKLENEAANQSQRALIVIDALNETPDRKRWKTELLGMIQEVLRRPHLALIISVRSDYLKQTLPELADTQEPPWITWEHPGFSGIEPDALLRYFEHYGVKAPVAPPLGEFSNPLYVQLLAKSMHGNVLKHWLPSWLEVWRAWMEKLTEEAREKLNLDDASRPDPIRRTMNKMAQAMLDNGGLSLLRHQADAIAKEMTGVEHTIAFLCSAGALIDRLNHDEEDVIEFGFERLSDTFVADRLLTKLFKGLATQEAKRDALRAALIPSGFLYPLASTAYIDHPLYYRRAGLLEALCLMVPKHTGVELPTMFPERDKDEWRDWQLAQAFNDSLRWRASPSDFGADRDKLLDMWQEYSGNQSEAAELDELIRFALIPEHPFAMEHILHPNLLSQDSPGARDALWSIHLVPLWQDKHSNLRQLVVWARDANLQGMQSDIALPAATLLAWFCASSQNELRLASMKGLTRLLAACPQIISKFLPDFLDVNDAYVLEALLIAVWGIVQDGQDAKAASLAAQLVYENQFPQGNARWCHISIRHYARCIVEDAYRKGWIQQIDIEEIKPPYKSYLNLIDVPNKDSLKKADKSKGFGQIVYSSTGRDFYLYIMGGNSVSLPFSSHPLTGSKELSRPFLASECPTGWHINKEVFDLALAARFVASNTLKLGWTAERFEEFDTGYETQQYGRMSEDGRTERIGKKYQWISWHTLLAYLTDNYQMRPDSSKQSRLYETPNQARVELHDPARWLQISAPKISRDDLHNLWHLPKKLIWPLHDLESMRSWINSTFNDLSPSDFVVAVSGLPEAWGEGKWVRLAAEHNWESNFAPGGWGINKDYHADLWWQSWPFLILQKDLPGLLSSLDKKYAQRNLRSIGRIDPANDWYAPLNQWASTQADWDFDFQKTPAKSYGFWLPVKWRPFVGYCGHPDKREEKAPTLLPMPSLFREWSLELDLRRGLVLHEGQSLFGLAGVLFGEDVLFANLPKLNQLLQKSGHSLVWWWRGERRAFMNLGMTGQDDDCAWADYHGIGYLGSDGRVQTALINKTILKRH